MTLAPLITAADLSARSIPTDSATSADIASASSAIREAAGCAITRQTSTVKLIAEASRRIELPGAPVRSVSTVLLDGVAVTDWALRGSSLWRDCWWSQPGDVPGELTVTMDHGWDEVPADIVDLACMLVAGAQHERADGTHRGVAYEREDDYQIGYLQDAASERVSAFELPERTKTMLRARFGTGSVVAGSAR